MNKKLFSIVSLLMFCLSYTQVGINTTTPNATLQIAKSINNSATASDGVLPPQMTKTELASKAVGTYTATQTGTIVYIIDETKGAEGASVSQVSNVKTKGLHMFDGTKWAPIYDSNTISIPIVYGTMASATTGGAKTINPIGTSKIPLNSYITLPPGKWLVTTTVLLYANNTLRDATDQPWIWARLTFNDGITLSDIQSSTDQSEDFVGSKLISGVFSSPVTPTISGKRPTYVYSLLSGQVILDNKSAADKMYGLMWWSSESNKTNAVTNYSFLTLSSASNGENIITAIKIN